MWYLLNITKPWLGWMKQNYISLGTREYPQMTQQLTINKVLKFLNRLNEINLNKHEWTNDIGREAPTRWRHHTNIRHCNHKYSQGEGEIHNNTNSSSRQGAICIIWLITWTLLEYCIPIKYLKHKLQYSMNKEKQFLQSHLYVTNIS